MEQSINTISAEIAFHIADYISDPKASGSWLRVTHKLYQCHWEDDIAELISEKKKQFSIRWSEVISSCDVTGSSVTVTNKRSFNKSNPRSSGVLSFLSRTKKFSFTLPEYESEDTNLLYQWFGSREQFRIKGLTYHTLPNGMWHGECTIRAVVWWDQHSHFYYDVVYTLNYVDGVITGISSRVVDDSDNVDKAVFKNGVMVSINT
jgi:hypothetical protein